MEEALHCGEEPSLNKINKNNDESQIEAILYTEL